MGVRRGGGHLGRGPRAGVHDAEPAGERAPGSRAPAAGRGPGRLSNRRSSGCPAHSPVHGIPTLSYRGFLVRRSHLLMAARCGAPRMRWTGGRPPSEVWGGLWAHISARRSSCPTPHASLAPTVHGRPVHLGGSPSRRPSRSSLGGDLDSQPEEVVRRTDSWIRRARRDSSAERAVRTRAKIT